LFHNSKLFGSCIIHILYTGCAKIKKNIFRCQKVKTQHCADSPHHGSYATRVPQDTDRKCHTQIHKNLKSTEYSVRTDMNTQNAINV